VSGGAYSTLAMSRRSARKLDDLLGKRLGRLGVWPQQALFTEDTQFLVYMNGVGSEPTEDLYGNDELQARRLRAVGGGRPSHGRDRRAPARARRRLRLADVGRQSLARKHPWTWWETFPCLVTTLLLHPEGLVY
jgi:hypothetical protein